MESVFALCEYVYLKTVYDYLFCVHMYQLQGDISLQLCKPNGKQEELFLKNEDVFQELEDVFWNHNCIFQKQGDAFW